MAAVIITALVIGLTGCTDTTKINSKEGPGIWTKVYGPGVVTEVHEDGSCAIETWNELFIVTPDFEPRVGQKLDVFIHFQHGSDEWAIVNVVLSK